MDFRGVESSAAGVVVPVRVWSPVAAEDFPIGIIESVCKMTVSKAPSFEM